MFLSVVYSPEESPLRFEDLERTKKRYNVASSRARDQMWLVHSVDPQVDLKPNDLRRRLIEHVRDPSALLRRIEQDEARTESDFERRVLQMLVARGYWVIPQYRVGYYRIDMVLKGHQVAIECDGDRFHPLERLQDDMERQSVLERLGWSFIRVRGTRFYRDPDRTIEWITERLGEMGVEPSTPEPGAPEQDLLQPELVSRVTRRAAEIRSEWEASAYNPPQESALEDVEEEEEEGDHRVSLEEPVVERAPALSSQPREAPAERITTDGQTPAEKALALANEDGLEVIDKRSSGGALWLVAGFEYSTKLRPLGFGFAPGGGRATQQRPAWYRSGR